MPYDSTITFTLDTICPWTYIGFTRLTAALAAHRAAHPSSPVTFHLRLAPYQLHPDLSSAGTDRYTWYKDTRYHGSAQLMDTYTAHMASLGAAENITIDMSGGTIANSLPALRVLLHLQSSVSPAAACAALTSLYDAYFGRHKHPSSADTLREACVAAGLDDAEAERVVGDADLGLREAETVVRRQADDGVDAVPWVVVEGRRRDFTLVGAKEVGEYLKALESVVKEAV